MTKFQRPNGPIMVELLVSRGKGFENCLSYLANIDFTQNSLSVEFSAGTVRLFATSEGDLEGVVQSLYSANILFDVSPPSVRNRINHEGELQEPYVHFEVSFETNALKEVTNLFMGKRAELKDVVENLTMTTINGKLPASSTLGIQNELKYNFESVSSFSMSFNDEWHPIPTIKAE